MKILFVTDQLPYPPRNGVTIPVYNFIEGLTKNHEIYLIWTPYYKAHMDHNQIELNRMLVKKIWVVPRRKKSKANRIKAEILMRDMGFNGWYYNEHLLSQAMAECEFDAIWISPVTVIDVFSPLVSLIKYNTVMVAGISDCMTALMRNNFRRIFLTGTPLTRRILCLLSWLRSWPLANTETRILDRFDMILTQTSADTKWLKKISRDKLSGKTIPVSNGVDSRLYNKSIKAERDILFLANLEALYGDVAYWLIDKVWSLLHPRLPNSRFVIVGKGASDKLKAKMSEDQGILHQEFIADLGDIYKGKGVSLAPTFKNYGLINKVIESMAAGVPVVGDSGSFNGIDGFENGRHGIVANGASQIADSVINLLSSPQKAIQIAFNARELIKTQFSWKDRVNVIIERIEKLQYDKKL